MISTTATFGQIPPEHWFQPDWIDEEKAKAGREKMQSDNIIYGGSVSYVVCAHPLRDHPFDNMRSTDTAICAALTLAYAIYFGILYAFDLLSVSQFFFRHPLVLKYRWYWRVEYVCTITSDLHQLTIP